MPNVTFLVPETHEIHKKASENAKAQSENSDKLNAWLNAELKVSPENPIAIKTLTFNGDLINGVSFHTGPDNVPREEVFKFFKQTETYKGRVDGVPTDKTRKPFESKFIGSGSVWIADRHSRVSRDFFARLNKECPHPKTPDYGLSELFGVDHCLGMSGGRMCLMYWVAWYSPKAGRAFVRGSLELAKKVNDLEGIIAREGFVEITDLELDRMMNPERKVSE